MDASQRRHELLARLAKLDPPSAEECFVLLWSYLDLGRIIEAENYSLRQDIHHFRIAPHPLGKDHRKGLAAAISQLGEFPEGEFELFCAQLLRAIDDVLNKRQPHRVGLVGATPNLDGQPCRVRRRNNFLAETFDARMNTQRDQSGTIDLYTPTHISVPGAKEGVPIETLPETAWGEPRLHRRLHRERSRLRVMMWPLTAIPDYPVLKERPLPELIALATDANEEALVREVVEAIRRAREQKVTLLVFPELAFPPATQTAIQSLLAADRNSEFPVLALFGCCHCLLDNGNYSNEAVLLDWQGREVFRHRKIAKYSHKYADLTFFGEKIESGKRIAVLESAFGNVTPLICLDLLHEDLTEVLNASHANVFCVPSLSPQTDAHQHHAKARQIHNRASTFVCNRTLAGPSAEAPSFYHVPAADAGRRSRSHPASASDISPYLVFSLEETLAVDKTGT